MKRVCSWRQRVRRDVHGIEVQLENTKYRQGVTPLHDTVVSFHALCLKLSQLIYTLCIDMYGVCVIRVVKNGCQSTVWIYRRLVVVPWSHPYSVSVQTENIVQSTTLRTSWPTRLVGPPCYVFSPETVMPGGIPLSIQYGLWARNLPLSPNWWMGLRVFGVCRSWWRHQMETFSALLAICAGNSPVSPVNSQLKGQWHGALMFPLICVWINDRVNNREAGDLRPHRAHYDVVVMHWGKYMNGYAAESQPLKKDE